MILEKLTGKNIFIYGTGHVARKFYKALCRHGLQAQVRSFVRTQRPESGEQFEGVPICSIQELSLEKQDIICLAVHESNRKEIEEILQTKTDQYIWIYPYLYELMFGTPEKENIEAPVIDLLKGFRQDLRLGVRLAAIEQQEGKNSYGFEYYIRAQMLHCTQETARHRLKQFQKLITEWKQNGYQKNYKFVWNRHFEVIDGNHRLAMAIYTGQDTVYGDVYPTNLSVTEIHGREPIQSKDFLMKHGFSEDEIQKLEQIQKKYLQRYLQTVTTSEKEECVKISIIIPVYNVYEWLDQCLDSVIHQTFSDFEVILINDGSTDGSLLKCQEWEKKDPRIRLITKENEGPSKTRNLGLQEAKGSWLVFLDADDWIDSCYLESMYCRAKETGADLVECDVYRVNNETGIQTYRVCSGYMGREYTLEEHIKYGYTAIWKCLFKKELFTKYGITFPDCHSEARAIYPLLLALSNRVENVQEALYYYRIFRKGSLTAQPRPANEEENAIGIQASELLLQGFQRCGIYHAYEKTLQEFIKLKLADLLSVFFYRKEPEDFRELRENYRSFVKRAFPESADYRYLTWGGYNLNRILGHLHVLHDPYCRFNFSSFISLMHPVREAFTCKHRNRYREIMLKREFENQFWNILEEIQPRYLILDFIEERFDMIAYGNGYLTKSDAFDDAQLNCSIGSGRRIFRNTEECHLLWEQSCLQFLQRMENKYPSTELILVQNYLSERSGDIHGQDFYENLEEIRQMNQILKRYYDFFKTHCRNGKVIDAYKGRYYFTDKQYEYGVIPSHLNEIVNQEIAGMIERSMEA